MFPRDAFLAGIVGGILMSGVLALGRMFGVSLGLESMFGAGLQPGPIAWIVGFAVHLVVAGGIGVMYGWTFDVIIRDASWELGVAFGLIHGTAALVVIAGTEQWRLLGAIATTATSTRIWDAGAADLAILFAAHAIYGGVVGGLYKRVRDGPPPIGG
jgi:hypothetical protein